MKVKKEYAILAGIIVVLLVYLIFGTGRNRMSYKVPKLTKIAESEITRIEITKADQTITLAGKEENWKILPQEYPADADKIQDMLEAIGNLTLTELAAEKQNYQRYELDEENKITVKAFKGEELVREFDIGKTPSTYRHTFVRIAEDIRVYYARESFRSDFDTEAKDLRDKVVLAFDKNEITGLSILQEEQSLAFTKQVLPAAEPVEKEEGEPATTEETEPETAEPPAAPEAWITADGKQGDKSKIDSLLTQMNDLQCDEYLEDKSKQDFQNPIYTITVKGARDYILTIYTKQEEENGKYPAVSSESEYVFLLSTYRAEQIMKKPEELFPTEEDE